jgi:conjugal transfer pilus assembly protein TraW
MRSPMKQISVALILMLPFLSLADALKDYGIRGATFVIKERSLLEVIYERLAKAQDDGKIAQLQENFAQKVKQKISKPLPPLGIVNTQEAREFFFEPSYLQTQDVKDHKERIIVKAGTSINPLNHLAWGEAMLFIDGDDQAQVQWALKHLNDEGSAKIVLVKGSPLELNDQYDRWFYFDQAGVLTSKLGIKQVPSIVTQDGLRLKIQEIKL